jgi:26S proteasome regulatory subunit, ATPase 3, interacting protein
MDAEITRLREATALLRAEEKELRIAVRDGLAQVPLPELRQSVAALEQEKAEAVARLAQLTSGNVQPISAKEREQISTEHRKWQKVAAARKKIRSNVWQEIEGSMGKVKAEEIKESLGLEF